MIRLLLWAVIIFIVWKVARLIAAAGSIRVTRRREEQPFNGIEEADYEDLTPKSKPPTEDIPDHPTPPDTPA